MLTISQIRNGRNYLTRHLSANDYYSENERVVGYWRGKGAAALGLSGDAQETQFEALRSNRHPGTGERLTPRRSKVEFHDVTFSAPKSVSIAAIVGGDERIEKAFRESSDYVLKKLEKEAMVRVRGGNLNHTESVRKTGNVIAAVFQHDSSRLLDPQLHAHMVLANASFDEVSGRWLALQPKQMMEATKTSIRREVHHELANRIEKLGYQVVRQGESFRIDGISKSLEDVFSGRAQQRRQFEQRYQTVFGESPRKRRVEQFVKEGKSAASKRFQEEYRDRFGHRPTKSGTSAFVKDWRSSKLKQITTREVRRLQQAKLSAVDRQALTQLIQHAREQAQFRQEPRLDATVEHTGPAMEKSNADQAKDRLVANAKRRVKAAAAVSRDAVQAVKDVATKAKTNQVAVKKRKEKEDPARRRVRISRSEILRRIRFGMQIQAACKGYHRGLVASRLRAGLKR